MTAGHTHASRLATELKAARHEVDQIDVDDPQSLSDGSSVGCCRRVRRTKCNVLGILYHSETAKTFEG
jgi:hypothetical protein